MHYLSRWSFIKCLKHVHTCGFWAFPSLNHQRSLMISNRSWLGDVWSFSHYRSLNRLNDLLLTVFAFRSYHSLGHIYHSCALIAVLSCHTRLLPLKRAPTSYFIIDSIHYIYCLDLILIIWLLQVLRLWDLVITLLTRNRVLPLLWRKSDKALSLTSWLFVAASVSSLVVSFLISGPLGIELSSILVPELLSLDIKLFFQHSVDVSTAYSCSL